MNLYLIILISSISSIPFFRLRVAFPGNIIASFSLGKSFSIFLNRDKRFRAFQPETRPESDKRDYR